MVTLWLRVPQSKSFRSVCLSGGFSWKTPLTGLAVSSYILLGLGGATVARADVLVIGTGGKVERYAHAKSALAFAPKPMAPRKEATASSAKAGPMPKARAEVLQLINTVGTRYAGHPALRSAGLSSRDWLHLFQANIEIESAYRTTARSHVGAVGLGQLMPATAKRLKVDPHDPAQNLDGSARYLLMMLGMFGSAELALAAYNAGPEAVKKYGGIPPYKETQGHVRKVLAVAKRLKG